MSDVAELAAVESVVATPAADASGKSHGELALYPLLSLYLWEEFGVYSRRIDEKRSSNKRGPNGNRWLYPDVVGMEDLGAEWHQEVRDCVNQYSDRRTKLWSFEAKLLINRSNVRECFFQAVSRRYRYYVPQRDAKEHAGASGLPRLPAAELESAVLDQLRAIPRAPNLLVRCCRRRSSSIRLWTRRRSPWP